MTAHGLVGSSPASTHVSVRTQGSAPARPPASGPAHAQLLQPNSTFALLRLHDWPDGGCPISYFEVQLRAAGASHWTLGKHQSINQSINQCGNQQSTCVCAVSSSVVPQRRFVVPGLLAASPYELRVTAHNAAGATATTLAFSTLTLEGGEFWGRSLEAGAEIWGLKAEILGPNSGVRNLEA